MYEEMLPILKESDCIKRHPNNPILSAKDMPYASDLVFNAGVTYYQNRYVMIFRNDYEHINEWMFGGTNIGIAFSDDGIDWRVEPKPFFTQDMMASDPDFKRIYDPRLTVIEDKLYMCFAMDTNHGVRGGIARVYDDFSGFDILSLSAPDNRNMVLFPEKVNGRYVRLERPFPVYSRGKDQFDVWISFSPDLVHWGDSQLLLAVENVPFANDKLGPAAPPIKTKYGWLTTFHGVDIDHSRGKHGWEEKWQKRYSAGIMLLDLENPAKVLRYSKEPLIAPATPYEKDEGFRTNVIFPGGMIAEEDGSVKIYYGSADTVECLATTTIDDLLALCTEEL